METPLVNEMPRLLLPVDRDPFLIGLSGPPTAPEPASSPVRTPAESPRSPRSTHA